LRLRQCRNGFGGYAGNKEFLITGAVVTINDGSE
jgi:hypothetical protein